MFQLRDFDWMVQKDTELVIKIWGKFEQSNLRQIPKKATAVLAHSVKVRAREYKLDPYMLLGFSLWYFHTQTTKWPIKGQPAKNLSTIDDLVVHYQKVTSWNRAPAITSTEYIIAAEKVIQDMSKWVEKMLRKNLLQGLMKQVKAHLKEWNALIDFWYPGDLTLNKKQREQYLYSVLTTRLREQSYIVPMGYIAGGLINLMFGP